MGKGRNIKGITIQLDGDATGLNRAIQEAEKTTDNLGAQLRDVNRLLKMDPKNVELLRQREELLAQSVTETEKKLEALNQASEKAAESVTKYDAWKEKFDPIQAEIDETRTKLNDLQKEQAKMEEKGDTGSDKYTSLQAEITETKTKLNGLRKEAREVNAEFDNPISPEQYNALQREIIETEQKLGKLKEGVESSKTSLESLCDTISGAAIMEAAENLSGAGEAIKDIGNNAMEASFSMSDAQSTIASNLNLTKEQTEEYGQIAKEVFEEGIVEDANQAAEAIVLITQQMGELNNTDLKNITSGIVAISERTGTDIQGNITGASKLMNEFGMSGQQALDLIAAGYQNGLNTSDDFMDTLTEYTPLFAEAGFSAEEMFQIMKNGMDNGAMNTDKVADAVKELQIRMGDGTFEDNIGNFSDATKKTFEEWKNGKATVADVAASVGKDLSKMTPKEQQEALSALSTQFEDLGIDASVALFNTGNAFDDVTGKAKKMSEQTPAEKWEASLRKLQDSLIPIGNTIVQALQPIIDIAAKIADVFSKLPGPVQSVIVAIGGLIALFTTLAPAIAAIKMIFTGFSLAPLLSGLAGFAPIILGIIAAVTAVILVIKNWATITKIAGEVWDWIKTTISSALEAVSNAITTKLTEAKNTISNVFNSIKTFIGTVWDGIKMVINTVLLNIKTVITTCFNACKTVILTIMNIIKTLITTVWNGIKIVVSTVVNGIKNTITKTFNAIKTVTSVIWNGIKTTITSILNAVKSFVSGAVNSIKSKALSAFHAMKSGISGAVKALPGIVKAPFNTIKGFITGLASQAYKWGSDFINGLKKGIQSQISNIVDAVKGLAGKIKSFLHFSRPDEGPLRDYETWMPDFMEGLAKGITSNMDIVKRAIESVSGIMSVDINGNVKNIGTFMQELASIIILLQKMYNELKKEGKVYLNHREIGRYIRKEV